MEGPITPYRGADDIIFWQRAPEVGIQAGIAVVPHHPQFTLGYFNGSHGVINPLSDPRFLNEASVSDQLSLFHLQPITRSTHHPFDQGRVPEQLVQAGYDPDAALIKRVVGRPGDQLEVKEGQLIRNGRLVEEPWIAERIDYAMAPVEVPEGELWVMGDNRNASLDSHLWGPLPEDDVIGTAVWRYWPLQRFGPIRFSQPSSTVTMSPAAIGSVT